MSSSASSLSHPPSNALPSTAHFPAKSPESCESPDSPDLRLIQELQFSSQSNTHYWGQYEEMGFVYMVAKTKILKMYESKISIFWKSIEM